MVFSRLAGRLVVVSALASLALTFSGCSSGPKLDKLGEVTPFALTDQNGAAFSSMDKLKGQVWVADFMFTTCPGPCPRMSSQMHQVQMAFEGKGAGQGIKLVSFTVDPEHDTPPVLLDYSKTFKASPGVWYFLTGTQADLHHLSHDVFKLGPVDGSLEHSTRFVLVDATSQIRGYYLTSEPDAIANLIRDAGALLEAKP
jgi:protein SCO1/2